MTLNVVTRVQRYNLVMWAMANTYKLHTYLSDIIRFPDDPG